MPVSTSKREIKILGQLGQCGSREVFLGFASARLLYKLSFADLLDEASGKGYQRRFNERHSLDFSRYIRSSNSTTIPLTLNLREPRTGVWRIRKERDGHATLYIRADQRRVLAQVDCQHRLGNLSDSDVSLPFMTFIGLSVAEETETFVTINSKAKGLSSSLTDFHEAKLANNLSRDRPELFIAMQLQQQEDSPWRAQLELGGNRSSGMNRRASFRTIQKATKRFLKATDILETKSSQEAAAVVLDFWRGIADVLTHQWQQPRKHFVTKGVGVYSLMSLAADLYKDAERQKVKCDYAYFKSTLSGFIGAFDWTNKGPLHGLGGEAGANEAHRLLQEARTKSKMKVVSHGR